MSTRANVPTTRFDMLGEATAADPFPALRALRELGPVIWHEHHCRWLVVTDREIRRLAGNHRGCTVEGTTVAELFGADAFISMDDPGRHNALRNVWVDAFRPPLLDRLQPRIDAAVDGLVAAAAERLRDGETVDLCDALCRPLPTVIIASLLGVPDEMQPDVVRWSDAMAAGGSAYMSPEQLLVAGRAREDAKQALADFLLEQMAYRRRHPGDDLVSALVHAPGIAVGDAALPDAHLVQNLRQLLFAGNETTAKWLAQCFLVYAERPDVRRELLDDPDLVRPANDEVMRWAGVVGTLARRVRGGAIEIGGVRMEDGDDVTLVLASGNRDPARYVDPDRFDIHRPPLPNLGFGLGLHNCLGSVLARMEGGTAVARFLQAVPSFAIAAPYRFSALPLRGPAPLLVALDR